MTHTKRTRREGISSLYVNTCPFQAPNSSRLYPRSAGVRRGPSCGNSGHAWGGCWRPAVCPHRQPSLLSSEWITGGNVSKTSMSRPVFERIMMAASPGRACSCPAGVSLSTPSTPRPVRSPRGLPLPPLVQQGTCGLVPGGPRSLGLANSWGPRRLPWFPEPHHAPLWLLDSTAHVGVRVPVWEPPLNRPSPAWGGHRGVAAAGHRASRAPSAGAEWLRLVAPGAVACVLVTGVLEPTPCSSWEPQPTPGPAGQPALSQDGAVTTGGGRPCKPGVFLRAAPCPGPVDLGPPQGLLGGVA